METNLVDVTHTVMIYSSKAEARETPEKNTHCCCTSLLALCQVMQV